MMSSKMMFPFVVSLCVGAAACQMPVDEEYGATEQNVEMASDATSEGDAACTTLVRGEGEIAPHERSMVLSFADPCHDGDRLMVYLSSVDEALLFDGAVLGGEVVLPDGSPIFVSGSLEKINGIHELQLYALESESSLIASMRGHLVQGDGGTHLRLTAKTFWY